MNMGKLTHHHNHHSTTSLLEELIMAPKMDSSSTFPDEDDDVGFLSNTWAALLNPLDQHHHRHHHQQQQHTALSAPPSTANNNNPTPFSDLTPSPEFLMNNDDDDPRRPFREFQPFLDALTSPEFCYDDRFPVPILPAIQQDCYDASVFLDCAASADMSSYGSMIGSDGPGNVLDVSEANLYGGGGDVERKSKAKKLDGQPSKNLMAERRRRKRLNDRLSMLRSIVPKISKMDRTSILGDTIDYMKELLDKIHKLRGQGIEADDGDDDEEEASTNNLMINKHLKLKDQTKPNEMQVRNPPKFEVERRKEEITRIEVCCTAKPGLLLSTLSTLDAVGLDVQHCVISCFNDFCLQASCYEVNKVAEHRSVISCEDVKQALFRNAGYGGRCL